MSPLTLKLLDLACTIFHIVIVLFILFAWIHPKTRRLNLIVIGLTLVSWLGLGFFYGFGYCFLTDWHWSIKYKLGVEHPPNTFIKLMLDGITGMDLNPTLVDTITWVSLVLATVASVFVNLKYRKT